MRAVYTCAADIKANIERAAPRFPFIVFYKHNGVEYNAVFQTMRKAKQFARVTGGRVECRLVNLLEH